LRDFLGLCDITSARAAAECLLLHNIRLACQDCREATLRLQTLVQWEFVGLARQGALLIETRCLHEPLSETSTECGCEQNRLHDATRDKMAGLPVETA
jgi:hypothetical protein